MVDAHHHDHHHQHGDSSTDAGMSVVRLNVDKHADASLAALAESVFVEFSADASPLSGGQSLSAINQHYKLVFSDEGPVEFVLPLDAAQRIALFMGHAPHGHQLVLVDADGAVLKLSLIHI